MFCVAWGETDKILTQTGSGLQYCTHPRFRRWPLHMCLLKCAICVVLHRVCFYKVINLYIVCIIMHRIWELHVAFAFLQSKQIVTLSTRVVYVALAITIVTLNLKITCYYFIHNINVTHVQKYQLYFHANHTYFCPTGYSDTNLLTWFK